MKKEVKEVCQEILAEIGDGDKYSKLQNYAELFEGAEGIISKLAWLVGPLLDAERDYRVRVQSYRKDGESVAGATAKAQCDDVYVNYKKIQYVYDLAEEQIKLIKRFSSKLEQEWNRTK